MIRLARILGRDSVLFFLIAAAFVVVAFVRGCIGPETAQARPGWPRWTEVERLQLGQCLRAEADMFRRDWPLIGWCLVKQWRGQPYNRTIGGQIRAHCALFAKGADHHYRNPARRRAIRASSWTSPVHGTREQWEQLRVFVQRFTSGQIPDPCPRCRWWAGHVDSIPPNWTCPVGPVPGPAGRLVGNSFCYLQR